jgi:integrase/recombinase XerD
MTGKNRSCNRMDKRVAAGAPAPSLYAADGGRKYLNGVEREQVLAAVGALPADKALFVLMLAWTGARVSEVLGLTLSAFQAERGVVAITTLKRRRHHVREVPLPPELISALGQHFERRTSDESHTNDRRLWPWHRTTAWA